jgi:acyl-coenzyme A thioesterase PaaI-like protein
VGVTAAVTAFDEATAVRRCAAVEPGPLRYEARPDPRFAVVVPGGGPPAVNGGVLVATVLRAVLDTSPHPYPVATSAHFLRVAAVAPAQVEVTWLKQGGTAATARAALVQDAGPVLEVTATTGALPADPTGTGRALPADPAGDGRLSWTGEPPRLPPIEECVGLEHSPAAGPDPATGYAAHVELLFDPATVGWRHGEPSGVPEMRAYFRLREHRDPDAYLLAVAADGLPPAIFGLGTSGWSPTVEYTWHMRAVPAPGTLRVATRCRHVSGGWFDEEAEVWDAAGRLVAQSRQLARVGRGRAGQRL